MPTPQNRRRRRRPSRHEGSSRRRRGSGSSANSGDDGGASLPRYQSLLASGLWLRLPLSADGDDPCPCSVSRPAPGLPSVETVEALLHRHFLEKNKMLDALVEYQVHKCLSDQTNGRRDSGGFHSADVAMYSVDDEKIPHQDFLKDCEKLRSRTTPVDEHTKLDEGQQNELYLRHARFRIKVLLLLKGKAIDKLDDAALDRKYPPNCVAEHSYFLDCERYDVFGWYFDSDFCKLASLTDYQRLVLSKAGGYYEYYCWSQYRFYYNTPEADRDYLMYWKAITEKIKWIEDYIHRGRNSDEWEHMWMKAKHQAIRIATDFDNINLHLASLGFREFILSTETNVLFPKDFDGLFFVIWKRVIKEQMSFREALKEVYDRKMFPSRQRCMKDALDGRFEMEKKFRQCTVGITAEVPEYRARELIAQQFKNKMLFTHGYEKYAEKKLKIAEYIGLIRKTST